MKSSMIRSAVAALAFCSNTVFGAQTAEQIVASLNTLTDKSQDLQAPAETITAVNGALIVVGQGPFPKIISGFQEIVTLATNDISQMQGTETITDAAEADNVYAAFREFSAIHQKLLTTLTGKAALLSTVPIIAAPMSAILRQDENVLDTLTFTLIDLVVPRAADIQSQGNSLSNSLETCIDAYSPSL